MSRRHGRDAGKGRALSRGNFSHCWLRSSRSTPGTRCSLPHETAPSVHSSVRSEHGMSLVEVLVGVTILAFVALGIMAFLGTAMKQNQLSLERSTATAIASERVQALTAMVYADSSSYANYKLPEETAAAGPPPTLTAAAGTIPGYPRYSRVVTLTYDQPVAGMLTVRVDVSWKNLAQNIQKTHTMITYLDPALQQGQ